MDIFVNDKPADITLDTEKTLGDVLSGIELWISPTGNRIQGISVNGKNMPEDKLALSFGKDIKDIKRLDVTVSSWRELAAEALLVLRDTCISYRNASFEDRREIAAAWEKSPAARFLLSDIPDLNGLVNRTISGEGLSAQELAVCIDERLREITEPALEISRTEPLVNSIAKRMEELSLDMQTGKDRHAAETVQLFSQLGEKLFRILMIYKSEGISFDLLVIDDLPGRAFIDEFNAAIKELSSAYENRDTVLSGDIAEYELAPRLLRFFNAIKDISMLNSNLASAS